MAQWQQMFGGIPLKQISFEHGQQPFVFAAQWGVNASDEIWRLAGSGWQQVAGSLKHVSIGISPDEGVAPIWGVNSANQIYRWRGGTGTGNDWERIPGSLKQISVGTSGVWGVNNTDQIFRWHGDQRTGPGYFERIGGSLKCVGSGKDTVWGVNSQNKIYRWRGGSGTGNTWDLIGGNLVQIDAGNVACGVNAQGQVWRWRGGTGTGNTWERLGTKTDLKYVSIAEHGPIYAIDTGDRIWIYV